MGFEAYDEKKKSKCRKSICWLVLSFFGLFCITFVVFLFICSMLFPSFGSDHNLGPLIVYPSNQIIFNMSDIHNTTRKYIETLQNITKEYTCNDNVFDFYADGDCRDPKLCNVFNASSHFGEACSPDTNFGYLTRQPCILLRLDWVATYRDSRSQLRWPPYLPVDCQGVRRVDHGRMRKYETFPERGFPSRFYALHTNIGVTTTCRHPATLLAVHFPDLTTGTNITITCSVWIPNVDELQRPRVTFSIKIV